jgi:hypothetical protein
MDKTKFISGHGIMPLDSFIGGHANNKSSENTKLK